MEANAPNERYAMHVDIDEHPLMGLPSDPGRDVEEAVREIREEVEARRRKGGGGNAVKVPTGAELKAAVEERLGKSL